MTPSPRTYPHSLPKDPYVVFRLGNEEKHSKVKEEGGNKVAFNETFSFNSMDDELKVCVMEDDTFVDDNLGNGVVHVGQYRQQPYPQDGYSLLIQLRSFVPGTTLLLARSISRLWVDREVREECRSCHIQGRKYRKSADNLLWSR